ncbi:MAG: helix-turn-helix domain-containing protein [Pseudonocardiaceae bacterium]|nr:helix-turn-helix domain-containing protein [Pseudonocardiaceae bacterium]
MNTGTAPAGSQAVDRAAALLALVVESANPRTFTSLVDELGLAKSTTSRLLQALERNRLRFERGDFFVPEMLIAGKAMSGALEVLRPLLAETARRGWAMAWEELEEGLVAVAAPVHTRDGSVVAAVSVSGPTNRISRADAARIGARLVTDTRAISRQLGHRTGKGTP